MFSLPMGCGRDFGRFRDNRLRIWLRAVGDSEGVTFVSSGATTDYLYYRTVGTRTCVSNSLPLLLADSGDRLDSSYGGYEAANNSIIRASRGPFANYPRRGER